MYLSTKVSLDLPTQYRKNRGQIRTLSARKTDRKRKKSPPITGGDFVIFSGAVDLHTPEFRRISSATASGSYLLYWWTYGAS